MADHPPAGGLSIGDLEARTGVSSATLRSWELRYGFPTPERSAGGQRRYSTGDVEQVHRVLAERRRGLELGAAIEAVRRELAAGTGSLFADLRAGHPQLDVMTVGLKVMLALTWAIEDECLSHASQPLLLGCFQTEESFRVAGRRWRELARTARRAVVLSDFSQTDASASPQRVRLPEHSPLLNEWSLVCDDPQLSVVLAAWERPRTATGARRFEAFLSLEPAVVRDTVAHYVAVARHNGLPDADGLSSDLVGASGAVAGRPMSLLRRFAVYADA